MKGLSVLSLFVSASSWLFTLGMASLLPVTNQTGARVAFAQSSTVMEVTETDEAEIQSVISQQLQAFRREDAEAAFSFAAPSIQDRFGDAEQFVKMVKTSYSPVYRAEAAEFLELVSQDGVTAQQVRLVEPEGNSVIAVYIMQKQSDQSWRISACYLQPSERTGISA